MRFLANENFPDPSIAILRQNGHDVGSIRTDSPGLPDPGVITRVQMEDRVILTFDRDYGELIIKHGMSNPPAVVFLRYKGRDPKAAAALVEGIIGTGVTLTGRFTVVEEHGIRQRIY